MTHTQTDKIDLIDKARELDSVNGALISLKDLYYKASFEDGMSKASFDRQVLELADTGKVWLHSHALPAIASEDEVVKEGSEVYMGMVVR